MFVYPLNQAPAASEWHVLNPFSFSIKFATAVLVVALKPVSLKIIG
jgi:hypothetical protein